MPKLLKKLCVSLALFVAFLIAGHFAMYVETWNTGPIAGSAVFGAGFASLIGGGLKFWYDIIA